MLDAKQFRECIVKPTLVKIRLFSQEAENLLVMTMAHESNCGEYLHQLGSGPAIGLYQMEKNTFDDLWNYIKQNYDLYLRIMAACDFLKQPEASDMEGNLYLATAMARAFYLRIPEPIPTDIKEMSQYCKKYWNTEKGKATWNDYYDAYMKINFYPKS